MRALNPAHSLFLAAVVETLDSFLKPLCACAKPEAALELVPVRDSSAGFPFLRPRLKGC